MSTRPSKIVCVGRSYADHAKELGNAVPDRPVLFIKPPSSLRSLSDGITWNKVWGNCHYECELSLRIDHPLNADTDPAKVLDAVGAVTLGLDLTLRELQDELKKKDSRGNEPKRLMVLVCWQTGWMYRKFRTGKTCTIVWTLMTNYVSKAIPVY